MGISLYFSSDMFTWYFHVSLQSLTCKKHPCLPKLEKIYTRPKFISTVFLIFVITNTLLINKCSTINSEKNSRSRKFSFMLLWRNHRISWNKEMSAHELSKICETKLWTKHFSLAHIYFVVSRWHCRCPPCNKI